MIILRNKFFGELADREYIKERKNHAKWSVPGGTIGGAALGGLIGMGHGKKSALALTAIGSGLGYLGGRHERKEALRDINDYQNAKSESDRAFLRNRTEHRKTRRQATVAAAC